MGIDLPHELAATANEAGLSWPRLDEDALHEQARVWRSTHDRLVALREEASKVANSAVKDLSEKASREWTQSWQSVADPGLGRLAVAAEGAKQAADRLERAADLVGESKVALVRDLICMAKIRDLASLVTTAAPAIGAQFDIADEWNTEFHEAARRLRQTVERLAESLGEVGSSQSSG